MKTFEKSCSQGDICIRRIDSLPDEAIAEKPQNGRVIVSHSETGHHHVMDAGSATLYRLPGSIMDSLLVVEQPAALRHLREFDTHEPIMFGKGVYLIRRQREYTPEGFRPVAD